MTTLKAALATASERWSGGNGGGTMITMASTCVALLGEGLHVETLKPPSGTSLLAGLGKRGLSPKSIRCYYGAFKRMLALSGYSCDMWPSSPSVPRVKAREAIQGDDMDKLIGWLTEAGYVETADLARLMRGTGGRINIEALTPGAMQVIAKAEAYDTLRITGKGGHERLVPVLDPELRSLLADEERLKAMLSIRYRGHLWRWKKGVEAVGIKTRLATPHAARHSYATDTYRKLGNNSAALQQLLGHASIATTAGYIDVTFEDLVAGLS